MSPVFKIETFSRDFTFKGFAPFGNSDFGLDYLTLDKSTVTVQKITADKGDFAFISAEDIVYQGIIDDIEIDVFTVLTLKPLLSIFDVPYYFGITPSGYVEDDIKAIIEELYVSNSDALQNISGLSVSANTHTAGEIAAQGVISFYDYITTALKAYGVAVKITADAQNKTLTVNISKAAQTPVIEADLPAVLGKNIVLGSSYGAVNKITFYNSADPTESVTYFRHTDGSIDTTDDDRVEPVFFDVKEIRDFTKAPEEAVKALSVAAYDNEIEITVLNTSKVVKALEIGTPVNIISKGNTYSSILTGFTRSGRLVTYKFGVVRTSLTNQLIIERRK